MVVSNIFDFHPDPWGNDPIWRACFLKVLKPPTIYLVQVRSTPPPSWSAANKGLRWDPKTVMSSWWWRVSLLGGGGGRSKTERWFQIFSYFHPYLGKMNPFWRSYFSDGLVQPPTRKVYSITSSILPLTPSLPVGESPRHPTLDSPSTNPSEVPVLKKRNKAEPTSRSWVTKNCCLFW